MPTPTIVTWNVYTDKIQAIRKAADIIWQIFSGDTQFYTHTHTQTSTYDTLEFKSATSFKL